MAKYIGLSLMGMTGFLLSCVRESDFGPQGQCGWGLMMHYGFGYGGMFMWVIFLIVVGFLIYFIFQAQKTKGQTPTESPVDILKRRYAKGEISKEEYETMKKDLD